RFLHGNPDLRALRDVGAVELDPRLLERLASRGQVGGFSQYLEHVFVQHDVLGTGVYRRHQVVLVVARGIDHDHAALVEQVRHRPGLTQATAVLGQRVPDVGPGAVAVV